MRRTHEALEGRIFFPLDGVRKVEYFRRMNECEVNTALKKMKAWKALGRDGIPIEARKCLGVRGVTWLTMLFNKGLMNEKMPDEWRKSILIPIYKNKADIQVCNNYKASN